jgi:hypothetical protein
MKEEMVAALARIGTVGTEVAMIKIRQDISELGFCLGSRIPNYSGSTPWLVEWLKW